MEEIAKLKDLTKKFLDLYENINEVTTLTDLDQAKVEGLKLHSQLFLQVGKVRHALVQAANDRRAALEQESRNWVKQKVKKMVKPDNSVTRFEALIDNLEEDKPAEEPAKKVAEEPKEKPAKKVTKKTTTKKAKK